MRARLDEGSFNAERKFSYCLAAIKRLQTLDSHYDFYYRNELWRESLLITRLAVPIVRTWLVRTGGISSVIGVSRLVIGIIS